MTRRSGTYWSTEHCGRCGEAHRGYSGKLNSQGVEYVVCGKTGKPMHVPMNARDAAFQTVWVQTSKPDARGITREDALTELASEFVTRAADLASKGNYVEMHRLIHPMVLGFLSHTVPDPSIATVYEAELGERIYVLPRPASGQ